MSGPLIFVSHSRIRPGQQEGYAAHRDLATELVDSEEPRVIGFNHYATDGGEVATVQIHPDAESLDRHLALYGERLAGRVAETLDVSEVFVYGRPSEAAVAMLGQMPDLKVHVLPLHTGGFLRPQPL